MQEAHYRERDAKIVARQKMNPCLIEHFFDLFETGESGQKAAYRRVDILEGRKKLRVVGYVQRNGSGRKNKVLCGWHPQLDTIKSHELPLTDVCLAIGGE